MLYYHKIQVQEVQEVQEVPLKHAWDDISIGHSLNCKAGDLVGASTGGANGGRPAIYRYLGDGKVSWYPNPDIAGALDTNWASPTTIDCNRRK